MSATVAVNFPPFDSGQYEDCEFVMSGGDATLTLQVAELPPLSVRFNKVRWHQFTALPNCTPEMIEDAYFQVIEDPDSLAVIRFVQQDSATARPYSRLNHFRIFLPEAGCHEVFAESATAL